MIRVLKNKVFCLSILFKRNLYLLFLNKYLFLLRRDVVMSKENTLSIESVKKYNKLYFCLCTPTVIKVEIGFCTKFEKLVYTKHSYLIYTKKYS